MATNMYAANRALFDRLKQVVAEAQPGSPLAEFGVEYVWPGDTVAGARCIYGGRLSFDQPGEDDAVDGNDELPAEIAALMVHIEARVSPFPDAGLRASDELVEEAGFVLRRLLAREPHICGGASVARIRSGEGTRMPIDDAAVSRLSLRVEVTSYVDYRDA